MKPTMTYDRPSTACHTKCSSSRIRKHQKPALKRGVHRTRTAAYQAPSPRPLARRSTRGEAGIRGHEMIGRYHTEITSSQGKRCGVFALEISTSKQLPGGPTLTPQAWDTLFRSDASRAWHRKMGWVGPDYEKDFYDEQLGLVLYLWGRGQGRTLQLGVAADGQDPFVLPLPVLEGEEVCESEEERTRETVWIHNDNAQLILGRPCNHYSGITILGPFS